MINSSYGIAFDLNAAYTLDETKRRIHTVLAKMFGNYYDKDWQKNRIYIELTTQNVFLENEDLTKLLFDSEITELERVLFDEFQPSAILAYYIDDSTGGRGFSLFETDKKRKRLWIDSDFDNPGDSGQEVLEEGFKHQLTEIIEQDGDRTSMVYVHPDLKHPLSGQRGIIEHVIKEILLSRFRFDYEWQEFRGDVKTLEADDFPIQDLQLLFGGS